MCLDNKTKANGMKIIFECFYYEFSRQSDPPSLSLVNCYPWGYKQAELT